MGSLLLHLNYEGASFYNSQECWPSKFSKHFPFALRIS